MPLNMGAYDSLLVFMLNEQVHASTEAATAMRSKHDQGPYR